MPHERLLGPNYPNGQISKSVSSPICKNIPVPFGRKSPAYSSPSRPTGGAARDRQGRGTGYGGRKERIDEGAHLADGEVVWS
jgi:hypothetical protein